MKNHFSMQLNVIELSDGRFIVSIGDYHIGYDGNLRWEKNVTIDKIGPAVTEEIAKRLKTNVAV